MISRVYVVFSCLKLNTIYFVYIDSEIHYLYQFYIGSLVEAEINILAAIFNNFTSLWYVSDMRGIGADSFIYVDKSYQR